MRETVGRLCQLLATICIGFVLVGCSPSGVPAYVVLLTPSLPGGDGGCTGVVVAPRQVVTAAHCVRDAKRIVTVYGQEAKVNDSLLSTAHDVALLTADRVLWVGDFAEFAQPQWGVDTQFFGYCPYQVSPVARHALYNGREALSIQGAPEHSYGVWVLPTIPTRFNKVCGGDSGTGILQNGKVVGILSAAQTDYFWVTLGSIAYSAPIEHVLELLETQQGGEIAKQ